MNGTSSFYSIQNRNTDIQLTDRLLAIYSLILILIGTPCNLLCCVIYFQKNNRSNSIKIIFGYLAFLDTIVLYTFNLNYVFREFSYKINSNYIPTTNTNTNNKHKNDSPYFDDGDINTILIKKNLEEQSLFICRFLSYLGKIN